MRSVRELLRDYNFVNTPEGRRSTVRFIGAFAAVVAGGFMVFFIAFSGGEDPDMAYQYGSRAPQQQFDVTVSQLVGNEWYIGYATHFYDPDQRDRYDEREIEQRIEQWQDDYGVLVLSMEPVHSDDEHNVLLGYRLEIQNPIGILTR